MTDEDRPVPDEEIDRLIESATEPETASQLSETPVPAEVPPVPHEEQVLPQQSKEPQLTPQGKPLCQICGQRPADRLHPSVTTSVEDNVVVHAWWCGCGLSQQMDSCFLCGTSAHKTCPRCHSVFCETHESHVDKDFCLQCLPDQAAPTTSELIREPLVSKDGVTHNGVHIIVPQEHPAKSFPHLVVEMTDDQLREHLTKCKTEVRRYEQGLDHWKVKKGVVEMELEHRDRNLRALQRKLSPQIKNITTQTATGIASGKGSLAKSKAAPINEDLLMKAIAVKLQQSGMTKEKMQQLIEAAKNKK